MSPELPPIRLPRARSIPESAVEVRTTTSGGPGGQHANRTATRVEVRVRIETLPLRDDELALLRERLGNRISGEGVLAVAASDFRSQHRNLQMARDRLEKLLREALAVQAPRRASKPSRSARERRLDEKRLHSLRKRARRWKPGSND